jgi:integrase
MMTQERMPTKYRGVYAYRDEAGDLWYGALVDIGDRATRKQKRQQRFRTARQAKQWRDEQLVKRARGEQASGGERTLDTWVDQWIALRRADWAPRGPHMTRVTLNRVGPALLAMPLVRVTTADVELALVALRARYKPATIMHTRTLLSQAFGAAVNMGLILRNPVHGTSPAPRSREGRTYWDRTQVKAFLEAAAGDEYEVLFQVLARTWMRIGEALALRWSDLDLGEGVVHIRRTVQIQANGLRAVGSTGKTRAAFRSLALDTELVRMLRHQQDRARLAGEFTADAFVFARWDGRFTGADRVRYHMRGICAAAGLPDVGPHMLRHAGASIAIRAGIDVKMVSARLGHTSVKLTLDRYVHVNEDDHRKAADVFASVLEG